MLELNRRLMPRSTQSVDPSLFHFSLLFPLVSRYLFDEMLRSFRNIWSSKEVPMKPSH